MRLADLTTLRVGGPARAFAAPESEADLVAQIRDLDHLRVPVLLLGAGSNLVVADSGFDGTVVRIGHSGTQVSSGSSPDVVNVTVAAGEVWDRVVERCVVEGLAGVEGLSGIPGLTGATPIQNVGAYGQDVSRTIRWVRVLDRTTGTVATVAATECGFSYRSSLFKHRPDGVDRHVVLAVQFELSRSGTSEPIRYEELARLLGGRADVVGAALGDVRDAVLELRRSKGMVLDEDDPDTVSVGSFFMNPLLDQSAAAALPDRAPTWPDSSGLVKTSAAWLIENAGFSRGYGSGAARISSKHSLALINAGGATTEDVLALARQIRDRVVTVFGIELHPEPRLVGCAL
jgi:UDP-N-acetylmuramate dehydrogenase